MQRPCPCSCLLEIGCETQASDSRQVTFMKNGVVCQVEKKKRDGKNRADSVPQMRFRPQNLSPCRQGTGKGKGGAAKRISDMSIMGLYTFQSFIFDHRGHGACRNHNGHGDSRGDETRGNLPTPQLKSTPEAIKRSFSFISPPFGIQSHPDLSGREKNVSQNVIAVVSLH